MDDNKKEYLLEVAEALAVCQLVEFELKFYIAQAEALAARLLKGKMVLKLSDKKSIEEAALSSLIKMFSRVSDNEPLIENIDGLKKLRDFVAHRSIAICHDNDGDFHPRAAADITPALRKIKEKGTEILDALQRETAKIVIRLHFDDLGESAATVRERP